MICKAICVHAENDGWRFLDIDFVITKSITAYMLIKENKLREIRIEYLNDNLNSLFIKANQQIAESNDYKKPSFCFDTQ